MENDSTIVWMTKIPPPHRFAVIRTIADQNPRPPLYFSKLEVVRYEMTKPSTVPNVNTLGRSDERTTTAYTNHFSRVG